MGEIIQIFKIFGALSLFLYGMKVMSEAIQRLAGMHVRKFFQNFLTNRLTSFSFGFIITAFLQSSSAISVIMISLVDAGMMSLFESTAIVLGANVGTTITGWLVAIGVGKFSLSDYALPILSLGLLFVFNVKWRLRNVGEFIIGFCLLFLGIYFLKQTFAFEGADSLLGSYFDTLAQGGLATILVGIFLGWFITIILQSSSAVIALIIVLISKDILSLEMGCVMILGSNIGTTLTAELSGIIADKPGKVLARTHTLFNVLGAVWMVGLLNPVLYTIQEISLLLNGGIVQEAIILAAFHTSFNLLNSILFLGFIPQLVRLSEKTILRKDNDKPLDMQAVQISAFNSPEIMLLEVQKDLYHFISLTSRMLKLVEQVIFEINTVKKNELIQDVKKLEKETDILDVEIRNYLSSISKNELGSMTAMRIQQLNIISVYLEEIADNYLHVVRNTRQKNKKNVWFNQEQRNQIKTLFENLDSCDKIMFHNLKSMDYTANQQDKAKVAEDNLDKNYKKFHKQNLANMDFEHVNYQASIYFSQLIMILENNGDLMYKVSRLIDER